LLSLASTERYDPSHIQQKDIPALVPKFTEYPYEAGSVLKPISLAIALDHHVVTPNSVFNTYNGRLQIGKRHWITDDEKFDSLTATDIIVHSSNVGISQISWKLTGKEFRKGLLDFGIAKPSGIDLSRDLPGQLKSAHILEHPLHRANSSYGYGMLVTFAQLFKAYSAFNNDGIAVTPRIVNYLEDAKGRHYILEPKYGNVQAISKKSANEIHSILKEVVKRGTGVKAQYPGLEIGGKTGTAHIAKHGRYVHEYHSSFYGFANDDHGHKYTIGVLVIRAKKYHKYFASQSAVPTFKNLTRILVDQGYLKVNQKEILKNTKNDPLYAEEISNIKTEVSIPPNKPEEVKKSPKQPKTVKELFEIKEKPKKRKISHEKNSALIPIKEKPSPKKSPHELFEDLF
jgi:cell division protein FtsI (penicillin-binding protein 3)